MLRTTAILAMLTSSAMSADIPRQGPTTTVTMDAESMAMTYAALANAGAGCDAGIEAYCKMVQPVDASGTQRRTATMAKLKASMLAIQQATQR